MSEEESKQNISQLSQDFTIPEGQQTRAPPSHSQPEEVKESQAHEGRLLGLSQAEESKERHDYEGYEQL